MSKRMKEHRAVEIILNIIIVIFAVTGTFLMLTAGSDEGVLEASGHNALTASEQANAHQHRKDNTDKPRRHRGIVETVGFKSRL